MVASCREARRAGPKQTRRFLIRCSQRLFGGPCASRNRARVQPGRNRFRRIFLATVRALNHKLLCAKESFGLCLRLDFVAGDQVRSHFIEIPLKHLLYRNAALFRIRGQLSLLVFGNLETHRVTWGELPSLQHTDVNNIKNNEDSHQHDTSILMPSVVEGHIESPIGGPRAPPHNHSGSETTLRPDGRSETTRRALRPRSKRVAHATLGI